MSSSLFVADGKFSPELQSVFNFGLITRPHQARRSRYPSSEFTNDAVLVAQAGKEMALAKWEAIQKGESADCKFLVGSEDSAAELVFGSKVDLISSSLFFKAALKGQFKEQIQSNEPIRIDFVEPKIFKMIMEFAHTCHLNQNPVKSLEDAIRLAKAANLFLMPPLVILGTKLIKKSLSIENVWKALNLLLPEKNLASVCDSILSMRTLECLKQPTFMGISRDSLQYILSMDTLNIPSEYPLVEACAKLAKEERDWSVMDTALPLLRLLTLEAKEINLLAEYLTDFEKKAIGQWLVFNEVPDVAGSRLCPEVTPRKRPVTFRNRRFGEFENQEPPPSFASLNCNSAFKPQFVNFK
ncbi:uncharacterized protein LOC132203913 [Neocloeon triangulifer]|uniref:uncharacterized protein LOC132203913 n=1 Tax=Neocloeon triangulifer TaxID=2078957 RepID=UPI00286EE1B9|nr:uncharacterized protein LOC132203913 [Neocloeon triangulifer]